MKKNIFSGAVMVAFLGLFFLPDISWAAGLVPCGTGDEPCTLCHLIQGFSNLVKYLLGLLVTISLAGLFFAGVMYIVSAGDDGMMKTAKDFAKACLIGFVVVLCAWLIINVALWAISNNLTQVTGKSNWYSFSITCK
jgi:hypothetical protein